MSKKSKPEARPASALEIVNEAIKLLPGELPIDGISPYGTLLGRLAYQHYHPARREVLCAKFWKFSIKTFTLDEPSTDFKLPEDFLRVQYFDDEKEVAYNISPGRRIKTSEPVSSLTYVRDEEDPTVFGFDFMEAFILLLAIKFGIGTMASPSLIASFRGRYRELIDNSPE